MDEVAVGSFLYNCFYMAAAGFTTTILPIYATELGADVTTIGPIWTMAYLSSFVMAFFWSSISDRSGKRAPYIIVGTMTQSLAYILQTFTENIYHMTVVMILGSILGSGMFPIFMTFVSEASRVDRRGRSMGIFFVGGSAGFAISVSLAGFIAEHYETKTVFYISSVLLIFALIVVKKFLWKFSINNKFPSGRQTNLREAIRNLKRFGLAFMVFWLAAICLFISDNVKITYVILFFEQEILLNRAVAALVLSLGIWAEIPSHLLLGPLSDKLGRKPLILVGLFTVFLSNILMSLSQNYVHAGLTMLLYGIAWGAFASASSAFVAELVDEQNRAKSMSLYNSARALAGIIAPATMSFAILETNFRTAFIIVAIISIAGFLLVSFGVRDTGTGTAQSIRRPSKATQHYQS